MSNYVKILPQSAKQRDYYSTSQIKLFRTCKVCWAAKYLDKIEKPASVAGQRGIDLHKILEDYLKTGKPIDPRTDYGKIVLSGIKHLPKPGIAEVEVDFVFEYANLKFGGFVDFYYQEDKKLFLCDHKTTKSFQYALNSEQLKNDLQANLYAAFLLSKFQEQELIYKWIYYKTSGVPDSRCVQSNSTLTFVMDHVNLAVVDCLEMEKYKNEGKTAYDFRPPPSGCRAFGGCASKLLGTQIMQKKSLKDVLNELAGEKSESAEEPKIHIGINPPVIAELLKQDFVFKNDAKKGELVDVIPKSEYEKTVTLELDDKKMESEDLINWKPAKKSFTLLIDTLPRKSDQRPRQLMDVLAPVFQRIAKDKGVNHYSFISYEGKAVFVTYLDQYLDEKPLSENDVVLLNTGSIEGRDAMEVLIAHAGQVFQGTK